MPRISLDQLSPTELEAYADRLLKESENSPLAREYPVLSQRQLARRAAHEVPLSSLRVLPVNGGKLQ